MTKNQRSQWDIGRFFQTLAYFDAVPVFSWLRQLLDSNKQSQPTGGKAVGVVLVAGATGGVGKRVVQRLQKRGYQVRSLVRDADKARAILGEEVELVVGDLTKPETLTAAMMADVQAVVCCTAVRVQPVGGDTPDRAKYKQGIKFYQPEVVGDTPERVEYQGVQNLVQVAAQDWNSSPELEKLIFDFSQPGNDWQQIWGAVDDVVMGGISQSNLQIGAGTAVFTGNVSTANSGGFASVRTRNFQPPVNLIGYKGIKLRLKGDGKHYKFLLRNESSWDGTAYSYAFDTVSDRWIDVCVPFAELVPVFRAKTLKDAPPFDPSNISSMQLMLSKFEYDGELNPQFEPGNFVLQVESVRAYNSEKLPRFILVSSAGVTRPGRPGIDLEAEPPAVRMNDQLGGILTWKLRGEDSVRASGVPYTIIRPCALTEEPGIKTLIFEQGDNIKGKVSRDAIAELCVQVLSQPQAHNVTFEVKEGDAGYQPINWQQLFARLQPDNHE